MLSTSVALGLCLLARKQVWTKYTIRNSYECYLWVKHSGRYCVSWLMCWSQMTSSQCFFTGYVNFKWEFATFTYFWRDSTNFINTLGTEGHWFSLLHQTAEVSFWHFWSSLNKIFTKKSMVSAHFGCIRNFTSELARFLCNFLTGNCRVTNSKIFYWKMPHGNHDMSYNQSCKFICICSGALCLV